MLIITGGTRGIGASIARLASETGRYEIAVTYNSRAPVSLPPRTMAVKCDVSKEEDIVGLFRTVDSKLGRVTHLVNNAGILPPIARLDSYSSTRLHSVFTTNTIGPFLCAREAVLRMSTRYGGSGGSIVNLSSAAARIGSPNEFIDYAGSKAALDALTLGLSKEVAKEGVRVNAVRPGLIETGGFGACLLILTSWSNCVWG